MLHIARFIYLCQCVGHHTDMPAKTAEMIKIPFGRLTPVGPRNHVLDIGRDIRMGRGSFGELSSPLKGMGLSAVVYTAKGIIQSAIMAQQPTGWCHMTKSDPCNVAFRQNSLTAFFTLSQMSECTSSCIQYNHWTKFSNYATNDINSTHKHIYGPCPACNSPHSATILEVNKQIHHTAAYKHQVDRCMCTPSPEQFV